MQPTYDLKTYAQILPSSGPLMGIDHGTNQTGIAISNSSRTIATSLCTIKDISLSSYFDNIIEQDNKLNIAGIIIGYPISLSGKGSRRSQAIKRISGDIAKTFKLHILLWDERFSTQAVERVMISAKVKRKKRSNLLDSAAATWILQGALDALSRLADFDQ